MKGGEGFGNEEVGNSSFFFIFWKGFTASQNCWACRYLHRNVANARIGAARRDRSGVIGAA